MCSFVAAAEDELHRTGLLCLCIGDFIDCSCANVEKCSKCRKETEPPKGKRKRLALHDTGNSRHFQFVSKQDVEVAQQPYVPPNMEKSTQWALKVFVECKQARQLTGEDCCPVDLLERVDPTELVKWLSLFAVEAKQAKGACYTSVTNSQLLGGLLRFMRSMNKSAPNFMDKKDTRFSPQRFGSSLPQTLHHEHQDIGQTC